MIRTTSYHRATMTTKKNKKYLKRVKLINTIDVISSCPDFALYIISHKNIKAEQVNLSLGLPRSFPLGCFGGCQFKLTVTGSLSSATTVRSRGADDGAEKGKQQM